MKYWLMKSEPDVYGIDHLRAEKRKTDHWDGIRNYQARNFMRDEMKKGDLAFFYHSNCEEPAIVGVMEIVREGYPDNTAFLASEKYFDAKSDPDNPRWFMVDIRAEAPLPNDVTLAQIKATSGLENMSLVKRARLSIHPVTVEEWEIIMELASG